MAKILTQAAVEKLKSTGKRRVIRDGASTALFLVVQPSGFKSWMMRFRRGDGAAKIFLGPLDISGRRHDGEPEIGQPLTLVQARRLASKVNADRAAGRDVVADHRAKKHRQRVAVVEAAANSFAAATKDFIREYAQPKVRGWKELASNLGLDAELNVKPGGLAHRWADRDVRTIDASDLFAVVEEARKFATPGIAARHEKPSEARARKLHAALSQMFSWLLRHRRVLANPMVALHPPAVPAARDRVLTTAEIKSFWDATEALKEPFGNVLRLLLLTGCRLNEIAKLRWEELSDDWSSITIPGSRTKNHLPFTIPLPPMARQLIAAQEREGPFVFSTTGGTTPISGWSKTKAKLDSIMDSVPAWRVHDLRRSAATHMAEIGIAPHIVEAVLNHISGFRASVAGTYNRAAYAVEKKEALERWSAHL
jgi:integrase